MKRDAPAIGRDAGPPVRSGVVRELRHPAVTKRNGPEVEVPAAVGADDQLLSIREDVEGADKRVIEGHLLGVLPHGKAVMKIQAIFKEGTPLHAERIPFPADNKVKRPTCATEHDLTAMRHQIEAQTKRSIIT
jgi:hypothetical protein